MLAIVSPNNKDVVSFYLNSSIKFIYWVSLSPSMVFYDLINLFIPSHQKFTGLMLKNLKPWSMSSVLLYNFDHPTPLEDMGISVDYVVFI